MPIARYDGLAECYHQEQSRIGQRSDAPIDEFANLVGTGTGQFVELGCDTGLRLRPFKREAGALSDLTSR